MYGFLGNDGANSIDFLGNAEFWVGYHSVALGNDHSKIWIISSDPEEWKQRTDWKMLIERRVPQGYSSDRKCAKYITVGAGPSPGSFVDEMKGELNRDLDVSKDLSGGVHLGTRGVDVIIRVESANSVMNLNFVNTTLEYDLFPGGWTAYSWDEFNSNSYIAGIQFIIGFGIDRPRGGVTPGFEKPVPPGIFVTSFADTESVKNYIYRLHPW